MEKYSDSEVQGLRQFSIVDMLAHLGRDVSHVGDMYFSPFRPEKTPSFHIDAQRNLWYDFGEGRGGDVIALVQELRGCSFSGALDFLGDLSRLPRPVVEAAPRETAAKHSSRIVIDEVVSPVESSALRSYARSRGIAGSLLDLYCSEVRYHREADPSRGYFALGFPNESGGWALRSGARGSKICTASGLSVFSADGSRRLSSADPSHGSAVVFEGFFDFLSWLQWSGRRVPGCDAVVLNSTSNIARALPFLGRHTAVGLCVDNDGAGDKVVARVIRELPSVAVSDCRGLYRSRGLNDFNELLTGPAPAERPGLSKTITP